VTRGWGNSLRQPAFGTVEVSAGSARARCRESEDLRRLHRFRKGKQFVGDGLRFAEVRQAGFFGRSVDNAERDRNRHLRLSTGADRGTFRSVSPRFFSLVGVRVRISSFSSPLGTHRSQACLRGDGGERIRVVTLIDDDTGESESSLDNGSTAGRQDYPALFV
jgi:hypothetical protein